MECYYFLKLLFYHATALVSNWYTHFLFSSDHIPVPLCMCVFLLHFLPNSTSSTESVSEWVGWVKARACVFRSLSDYWYSVSALCTCVHTWAACLLLKTAESQSSPALETSAAFCQAFWSWIQQPWQPRHAEQIFTSESFSFPHSRSFSFSSDRRMCSAAEHQTRWWIAQRHQGETKLCAESEAHGCQLETLNVANCSDETRLRDGFKICRSLHFLKLTSGWSRWRR